MRRRHAAARLAVGAVAVLAAATAATVTRAQRLEARRPKTVIVGSAPGSVPMARVDARRTGFSRTPLPVGTLRIAWHHAYGAEIRGAPLVTATGDVIVATARGEALVLDGEDGTEHPRVGPNAHRSIKGPPALLADGTVAFVTDGGDVVGFRGGALRFKTHIAAPGAFDRSGVLALDDGGAALAVGEELVVIDGEGNVRARHTLDESIGAPFVAALGKLAVVTVTGKVHLWEPGRPAVRVGSFGEHIDGEAALVDDHTLVAVCAPGQLVELDLLRGVAATRTSSTARLLGPPAFRGDTAYLLAVVPGRIFALTIDGSGQELARVGVSTSSFITPDAGPGVSIEPSHTGPLVDRAGTLAFATPEGLVGVLTKGGSLDMVGEPFCSRSPGFSGHTPAPPSASVAFAGLAPAGPHAFVVACETGAVAKITSLGEAQVPDPPEQP